MPIRHALVTLTLAAMAATAGAQTAPMNRLDVGVAASTLSDGQPDGQAAYARLSLPDAQGATYFEAMHRRAFSQHANLLSVGRVQTLDADWFASGFATVSAPGDFLPHSKLDASLTRKLLPGQMLWLTAGLSRSVNHHGYRDEAVQAAATVFLPGPWWGEAGWRHNTSRPGPVSGDRGWLLLGWRQPQLRELTLRLESGQEGWSVLGAPTVSAGSTNVVGFHSRLVNLAATEWLDAGQGVKLAVEHYANPYYRRLTLDVAYIRLF